MLGSEDSGYKNFGLQPDKNSCMHHHTNKRNLVGEGFVTEVAAAGQGVFASPSTEGKNDSITISNANQSFVWWPNLHDLKTHYLRELGFLASFAQLCGATVFWVSMFWSLSTPT